eukprot:scaffold205959_cov24-Tisochrysis_lutea.AAC.2
MPLASPRVGQCSSLSPVRASRARQQDPRRAPWASPRDHFFFTFLPLTPFFLVGLGSGRRCGGKKRSRGMAREPCLGSARRHTSAGRSSGVSSPRSNGRMFTSKPLRSNAALMRESSSNPVSSRADGAEDGRLRKRAASGSTGGGGCAAGAAAPFLPVGFAAPDLDLAALAVAPAVAGRLGGTDLLLARELAADPTGGGCAALPGGCASCVMYRPPTNEEVPTSSSGTPPPPTSRLVAGVSYTVGGTSPRATLPRACAFGLATTALSRRLPPPKLPTPAPPSSAAPAVSARFHRPASASHTLATPIPAIVRPASGCSSSARSSASPADGLGESRPPGLIAVEPQRESVEPTDALSTRSSSSSPEDEKAESSLSSSER